MNNAAKVLQTVAANVDTDVMEPLLEGLYDMIMLTDTSGMLTGEEQVTRARVQRRRRSATPTGRSSSRRCRSPPIPIDAPIIGEIGRARLLRAVFKGMGLPDDIVPDDQTLQAQMDAQKRMQAAGQALLAHAQGQGIDTRLGQPGQPGQPHPRARAPAVGARRTGQPRRWVRIRRRELRQAQGNQARQPRRRGRGLRAGGERVPPRQRSATTMADQRQSYSKEDNKGETSSSGIVDEGVAAAASSGENSGPTGSSRHYPKGKSVPEHRLEPGEEAGQHLRHLRGVNHGDGLPSGVGGMLFGGGGGGSAGARAGRMSAAARTP